MGLSALNAQHFNDNFIDNSNCDKCHTAFEIPIHYFLECLACDEPHQSLRDLHDLLPTDILQNKKDLCSDTRK